jgi:hypothetical protein
MDSVPLVPVATGKLSESRFGRILGVYDEARECCRTIGSGGGAIGKWVRFGELPTCGIGRAAGGLDVPDDKMDSTEAGSIVKGLGELAIAHIVL